MDKAEELTLKQVEITLQMRIERGEVEYNGRTVLTRQPDERKIHPLLRLLAGGYLETYHVYTGQRYKDLRDAAFPETAIRSHRTEFNGDGFGVCSKTLYARVMRSLSPKDKDRVAISFAEQNIDGYYSYSDADIKAIGSMAPAYQAAFETLHTLIEAKKTELQKTCA